MSTWAGGHELELLPTNKEETQKAYKRARLLFFLLSLLLILSLLGTVATAPAEPGAAWGRKPVLAYYALTPSLAPLMQAGARLTAAQMLVVQAAAQAEQEQFQTLELGSLPVVQNQALSLEEKQAHIRAMGYNRRVMEIIYASQQRLRRTLDADAYRRLAAWAEQRWQVEVRLHGALPVAGVAPAALRTYRVYATRYDSGGAYTVALPDKCVKFSNAGNSLCEKDGYVANQGYSVFMSYQKSASAVVGESGPWNVDDNYWAGLGDPQPRRMFADLATGMPEAQAAFFNGYNGGADQFGRTVTAPYGIDLARQVSIDIGLQPGVNDWIDVSFMWTEEWEAGGSQGSSASVVPVETAAPKPDGSIVHKVKEGQSLWAIAIAYGTTIQAIQELNDLAEGSVITPGQKLLLRPAGPAPTTPVTEAENRSTPQTMPGPSQTPSPLPAEATEQATPVLSTPALAESSPAAVDGVVLYITAAMVLGGLTLLIAGRLLSRRS
jgi:LysM repeat protein